MLKLTPYLKGYRAKTVLGPLFKLVEALFELFTPIVVAWIIDKAIPMGQKGDFGGLIYGGVIILVLGVLGLGFALTAQFFASRASLGFGTNLRRDLYAHINTFSYAELDRFSTISLITRLTSDVNQTQQAVAMFIRLVLRAPFIVVGAIIMAMLINVKLSLIFIGASALIGIALFLILTGTMPKYKRVQEKLDDVSRLTRENLAGARVVRAFDAEDREKAGFDAASESLSSSSIKAGALSAILNPLTYAVLNLAVIAILYFGGKTVYYGDLTQGEIIALINYMTQILNAMVVFANLLVTFTKASASASRINEVLAVKPSMVEGAGAEFNENEPAIRLDDVTFRYEGNVSPSLEHVTLSVNKGDSVGILGGTGCGKTTLISLMTRLYDATEGKVYVFGNDIKDYADAQLYGLFGVAPQKAVLFSGTVRENMQWGKPDATDEEIEKALVVSQSKEFVDNLKGRLDFVVAQDGKNLSGGQRQRLTIARALVSQPEILILDDSSSALDFATDANLRKALNALRAERKLTTVTVSQRATSIKYCDLIVVLDDGKIVGQGTHEELINSCEVYREICLSQNKEEEVK
ncbi:MAG: ABC transporter ATP-binding protein/permease [Clostridiales bacterium]|nr:ABC transporter ATP-binding protein/permease [Clostridiales bacterium]